MANSDVMTEQSKKSSGNENLTWRMAVCDPEYRMAAWIAMALGFFQ